MEASYHIADLKAINPSCEYGNTEPMTGDTFWKRLEDEKAVQIPTYIKNILKLNNLDNPLSFQCITEDTYTELENFARESMRDLLKRTENLEHYYGRYSKMPEKFRFLIGDRFMLKSFVAFVRSKPEDYWRTPIIMPHAPQPESYNHVYIKSSLEEMEEEEEQQQHQEQHHHQEHEQEQEQTEDESLSEPLESKVTTQLKRAKELNHDTSVEAQLRARQIKELVRIVKHSVWRDLHDKPEFRSWLKNISVKVGIEKLPKSEKQPTYLVTGSVKCVICSNYTSIRKVWTPKVKEPRWVISNYRRHIKNHFKAKRRPEYYDFDIEMANYDTYIYSENAGNAKTEDSVDRLADDDNKDSTGFDDNQDSSFAGTGSCSADVSCNSDGVKSNEEAENQEEDDMNEVSYTVTW